MANEFVQQSTMQRTKQLTDGAYIQVEKSTCSGK